MPSKYKKRLSYELKRIYLKVLLSFIKKNEENVRKPKYCFETQYKKKY